MVDVSTSNTANAPTHPPSTFISGSLHKLYNLGQRITPDDLAEEIEVGPPTIGRKWGGTGPKSNTGTGSGTRSAVSLADLVKGGALAPGKGRISVSYKGTTINASLTEDGSIEFQGKRYQSATSFSINFKRTITPSKLGDDGWKSVLYDGKPLEHYRKVFLEQMKHRNATQKTVHDTVSPNGEAADENDDNDAYDKEENTTMDDGYPGENGGD